MFAVLLLLFELVFLGGLNLLSPNGTHTSIYILFIIFESLAILTVISHNSKLKRYQSALTLGYFERLFFLFFDIYGRRIFILPNSLSDTSMFYYGALEYSRNGGWTRGYFPLIMGTIMRYIGTNRLYLQFLLLLCSVITICVFPYILEEYALSERARKQTVLIISLLPNFAILSVIFLRESIVTMFVTISLFFFTRWLKKGKDSNYLFAFATVFLGALFHSGCIGIAAGYIVVRLLYDRTNNSFSIKAKNIIASLFFLSFCFLAYVYFGDDFFSKMSGVDEISDIANVRDVASSSYAKYVGNSNSIFNFIIYTIPRIFFFLCSPVPGLWRGLPDILSFFFSAVFYIITVWKAVRIVLNHKKNKNKNVILVVLIVATSVTFIFAWGVSNSGSALRHRDKLITIYGTIFALSTNHPEKKDDRVQ